MLLQAPDESRHVGTALACVGVNLVQDQEAQDAGRGEQPPVVKAGEKQFQHHIVGHQDVGWVGLDLLTRQDLTIVGLFAAGGTAIAVQRLGGRECGVAGVEGDTQSGAVQPPGKVVVL